MSRAIVARAPTRLDFGGGWTDVPPYAEREGGAVCSVAIARYATATVATGERAAARSLAGRRGATGDPEQIARVVDARDRRDKSSSRRPGAKER